jgi:dinuclear metal center YbgI/SA1388 family protein
MSTIKEVISAIEKFAPLSYQESYDNAGLIVGNPNDEVKGALLCLDSVEATIDEAITKKCNLVIAHHPIVFSGLKSITGKNYIERTIIKAIKNDIAIYAAHTNLDNVKQGVNKKIADKIGLEKLSILSPKANELKKLVCFVPRSHLNEVRTGLFNSGCGEIGNYDQCSFNIEGTGTFRAGENTNPFVGNKGEMHQEEEIRVETIFESYKQSKIISAMIAAHPYEEVAYDIYPLSNKNKEVGSGMIGELPKEMSETEFLKHLKQTFNAEGIRYTNLKNKTVKKVAVCGGSGSFLLPAAIQQNCDVFVTADFKYHQFFDAENKIVIADIGHYESEQFTVEIFDAIIKENFSTFATYFSEIKTNPINYL